jgi:hypothetical protein
VWGKARREQEGTGTRGKRKGIRLPLPMFMDIPMDDDNDNWCGNLAQTLTMSQAPVTSAQRTNIRGESDNSLSRVQLRIRYVPQNNSRVQCKSTSELIMMWGMYPQHRYLPHTMIGKKEEHFNWP